jgi:hypothetical protein
MSSGFRSSCYWTDWNWANTENIRIGLVFVVLAQWKFLYCIDRFDHIKANKSKLINKKMYSLVHQYSSRLQMCNLEYCRTGLICHKPLSVISYIFHFQILSPNRHIETFYFNSVWLPSLKSLSVTLRAKYRIFIMKMSNDLYSEQIKQSAIYGYWNLYIET